MDWGGLITAALASSALTGLVMYLIERRARKRLAEATADRAEAEARKTDAEAHKAKAEAENLSLEGAFRLIQVLTDQLKFQEGELGQLKQRVVRLEGKCERYLRRIEHLLEVIRQLVAQIRDLGAEPVVEPDPWEAEEEPV